MYKVLVFTEESRSSKAFYYEISLSMYRFSSDVFCAYVQTSSKIEDSYSLKIEARKALFRQSESEIDQRTSGKYQRIGGNHQRKCSCSLSLGVN